MRAVAFIFFLLSVPAFAQVSGQGLGSQNQCRLCLCCGKTEVLLRGTVADQFRHHRHHAFAAMR